MHTMPSPQAPTMPLFHYTTAAGLAAILRQGKLWASSVHCTNDAEEFVYGFSLTRDLCANPEVIPASFGHAILAMLNGGLKGFEMQSRFVASFSEDGDLLSQWRAYSGNGPGFSIGFNPEDLLGIAARNGCSLLRCVYGPTEQAEAVKELFRREVAAATSLDASAGSLVPDGFAVEFLFALRDLAATFKHRSFAAECEWRLVTPSIPSAGSHIHFRAGTSLLIPYVELELASEAGALPISHAFVGPTPLAEASRISLVDALATYRCTAGANDVAISASPFRSWR